MPQYEAGSDGKCFNIRQGVRGRIRFGTYLLLVGCQMSIAEWTCESSRREMVGRVTDGVYGEIMKINEACDNKVMRDVVYDGQ